MPLAAPAADTGTGIQKPPFVKAQWRRPGRRRTGSTPPTHHSNVLRPRAAHGVPTTPRGATRTGRRPAFRDSAPNDRAADSGPARAPAAWRAARDRDGRVAWLERVVA